MNYHCIRIRVKTHTKRVHIFGISPFFKAKKRFVTFKKGAKPRRCVQVLYRPFRLAFFSTVCTFGSCFRTLALNIVSDSWIRIACRRDYVCVHVCLCARACAHALVNARQRGCVCMCGCGRARAHTIMCLCVYAPGDGSRSF